MSKALEALRNAKRLSEPAVLRDFLSAEAAVAIHEYIRRESVIDTALHTGNLFVCLGTSTTLTETSLTQARTRKEFESFQQTADRGFSIVGIERHGMPVIVTIKAELERVLEEALSVGVYFSNMGKSVLPQHADAHMSEVVPHFWTVR